MRMDIEHEMGLCAKDSEELVREAMERSGLASFRGTNADLTVRMGYRFAGDDSAIIRELTQGTWQGANFSTRIWTDMNKLATVMDKTLLSGMLSGKSVKDMARGLAAAMDVQRYKAARLVYTEVSRMQSVGSLESYKLAGIEEYEWLSGLDKKTCERCGNMDGAVFKVSEAKLGETLPPLHPFCRCTTVAHDPDEDKAAHTRAATDPETGETVKVGADTTWREWKDESSTQNGGYSGAKKTSGWEDRHAKRYYEEIRKREAGVDAAKIAQHTPFTKKAVEEIRQHMFISVHQLGNTYKRFDPAYEEAQTWQRLTEGKGTDVDMLMLKHEYVELTQMRIKGYNYDKAHDYANQKYNWYAEYRKSHLEEGE